MILYYFYYVGLMQDCGCPFICVARFLGNWQPWVFSGSWTLGVSVRDYFFMNGNPYLSRACDSVKYRYIQGLI